MQIDRHRRYTTAGKHLTRESRQRPPLRLFPRFPSHAGRVGTQPALLAAGALPIVTGKHAPQKRQFTYESPSHSWKLMVPMVVSQVKLGNASPRFSGGIFAGVVCRSGNGDKRATAARRTSGAAQLASRRRCRRPFLARPAPRTRSPRFRSALASTRACAVDEKRLYQAESSPEEFQERRRASRERVQLEK